MELHNPILVRRRHFDSCIVLLEGNRHVVDNPTLLFCFQIIVGKLTVLCIELTILALRLNVLPNNPIVLSTDACTFGADSHGIAFLKRHLL